MSASKKKLVSISDAAHNAFYKSQSKKKWLKWLNCAFEIASRVASPIALVFIAYLTLNTEKAVLDLNTQESAEKLYFVEELSSIRSEKLMLLDDIEGLKEKRKNLDGALISKELEMKTLQSRYMFEREEHIKLRRKLINDDFNNRLQSLVFNPSIEGKALRYIDVSLLLNEANSSTPLVEFSPANKDEIWSRVMNIAQDGVIAWPEEGRSLYDKIVNEFSEKCYPKHSPPMFQLLDIPKISSKINPKTYVGMFATRKAKYLAAIKDEIFLCSYSPTADSWKKTEEDSEAFKRLVRGDLSTDGMSKAYKIRLFGDPQH